MKRLIAIVAAAVVTCLPVRAGTAMLPAHQSHDQKGAGPLAGTWNMSVDSPHGSVGMTLVLQQEGKTISGTLTSGMGERTVKGQYADSTLSLETTDDASNPWTVTGRLTAQGGLQGHVSASVGDMKFTAERVKAKQ